MKGETVRNVSLGGDFFALGDLDELLLARLRNVRLERQALAEALPERLDDVIMNLRKDDFIDMLVGEK